MEALRVGGREHGVGRGARDAARERAGRGGGSEGKDCDDKWGGKWRELLFVLGPLRIPRAEVRGGVGPWLGKDVRTERGIGMKLWLSGLLSPEDTLCTDQG